MKQDVFREQQVVSVNGVGSGAGRVQSEVEEGTAVIRAHRVPGALIDLDSAADVMEQATIGAPIWKPSQIGVL